MHWLKYTKKMDTMLEEAFRLNVKWSLQELSRAINGDGKNPPNPLFRVKVLLDGDKVRLFCSFVSLQTRIVFASILGVYQIRAFKIRPEPEPANISKIRPYLAGSLISRTTVYFVPKKIR